MTAPAGKLLNVLVGGEHAAVIVEGRGGRLELTYDDAWQNNRAATPLSLSMPLTLPTHNDPVVRALLWGLLPDNEQVLDRWARSFGGTDAHAKNYSVLLAGSQVRLAPLYDVASALPYDDMYAPKLRMAMRIGGEYRLASVGGRHWRRFATTTDLDPDATVARIDGLAARLPDALATAVAARPVRALHSELPSRLLDRVAAHARRCRRALGE